MRNDFMAKYETSLSLYSQRITYSLRSYAHVA